MDNRLVFSKTRKGEEEISSRRYHLPQKLRIALILVDGHSDVRELHAKAGALADLERSLEELAIGGFIQANSAAWQPPSAPRPQAAARGDDGVAAIKARLIDIVIMTLGKDADRAVNKLRRCGDTRSELLASVNHCEKLVRLTIDEQKAAELADKCEAIIRQFDTQ